jgi:hypothetical protein
METISLFEAFNGGESESPKKAINKGSHLLSILTY